MPTRSGKEYHPPTLEIQEALDAGTAAMNVDAGPEVWNVQEEDTLEEHLEECAISIAFAGKINDTLIRVCMNAGETWGPKAHALMVGIAVPVLPQFDTGEQAGRFRTTLTVLIGQMHLIVDKMKACAREAGVDATQVADLFM
jgi:hypothetical protein